MEDCPARSVFPLPARLHRGGYFLCREPRSFIPDLPRNNQRTPVRPDRLRRHVRARHEVLSSWIEALSLAIPLGGVNPELTHSHAGDRPVDMAYHSQILKRIIYERSPARNSAFAPSLVSRR